MRDIKFRVWNKEIKRFIHSDWNYGVLSFWDSIQNDFTKVFDEVQQFTGLKDKNGKDIYEGDIVLFGAAKNVVEWHAFNKVEYGHGDCSQSLSIGFFIGSYYGEGNEYEVIGNIYETPELLK